MDKHKVSSLISDFYALKYVCTVAAKEEKDIATISLLGFFLQIEADTTEELVILKLTSTVALLLVEPDNRKW